MGAGIAVGELAGDIADLRVVCTGQAEQPHLGHPGGFQAMLNHGADDRQRAFPDRAGDHPRLTKPAAPATAPEDLHRIALVHRLGQRDERSPG